MKRTVILTRHAKSDWNSGVMTDFDRPLNERGMRDAPVMGKRLLEKQVTPQLIIASTARRAAATAKLIARAIGYNEQDIKWVEALYHCYTPTFEKVISEADDAAAIVMIVAHNPGITEYANEKVTSLSIDNMPTCSMVAFDLEAGSWSQLPDIKGTFRFFDYPKNQ